MEIKCKSYAHVYTFDRVNLFVCETGTMQIVIILSVFFLGQTCLVVQVYMYQLKHFNLTFDH